MNLKTKFYINQEVFIIDNDNIVKSRVNEINVLIKAGYIDVRYSFITQKAITSLDQDKIVSKKECQVYATATEIVEPFINLPANENVN